MLICFAPRAQATYGVSVTVDGKALDGAFISNNLTMVPVRSFAQTIDPNSEVIWLESTRSVIVKTAGLEIRADSGKEYITANGRYLYVGKNNYITPQGSFVLPVRTLAKAFGASVDWIASSRTAAIGAAGQYIEHGDTYYVDEDLYWLSRIISAEARGESLLGQIAVGNVVMNRVASKNYPNTIYGVVFDKNYGVQFTPAANGTVYQTPTLSSVIAAKLVLDGANVAGNCLYFLNEKIATSFWIVQNCTYVMTIGNHSFYV